MKYRLSEEKELNLISIVVIIICLFILFCAARADAQTATVTATVTDGAGQTFNNGTFVAEYIKPTTGYYTGNPKRKDTNLDLTSSELKISGSLDSSGHFSTTLTRLDFINPTGGAWKFTVTSAATSQGFQYLLTTLASASVDISSQLSGAAGTISVQASSDFFRLIPKAYNSTEINGAQVGSQYWDLTLNNIGVCTSISGGNCIWSYPVNGSGGNTTWTGNNIWTGLSSFKILNNIRFADQFTGVDFVDQVTNAIANASAGQTIFLVYNSNQSSTSVLTISKSINLIIGNGFTLPQILVNANNVHITCLDRNSTGFTQSSAPINSGLISIQGPGGVGGGSGITVENCGFTGVLGASLSSSQNNGIYAISGSSNLKFINNVFTGFQGDAITVFKSSDVEVSSNYAYNNNGACVRMTGVIHQSVKNNICKDTHLTTATFTVGMVSDAAGVYQNSTDLQWVGNHVSGYYNAQCYLFHDGSNITFTGNGAKDCKVGAYFGTFATPDVIKNVTVDGFIYAGPAVGAYTTTGANAAVTFSGNPSPSSLQLSNVSMSGGSLNNCNTIVQADTGGCITANDVNGLTINGVSIQDGYGLGIGIGANVTLLNVGVNTIKNIQQTAGSVGYGFYVSSTGVTGQVQGLNIDGVRIGLRFDANNNPGLRIGINNVTNFTSAKITNSSNALIDNSLDGTFSAAGLSTLTGGFKAGASGSTINDSRNLFQLSTTLTTTAATSDNVSLTGVTASSKCGLQPTNASAATNVATTYISAKTTNQITVTHTATASMTYDVFCSVQ